jgi:hypothetical protein
MRLFYADRCTMMLLLQILSAEKVRIWAVSGNAAIRISRLNSEVKVDAEGLDLIAGLGWNVNFSAGLQS